MNAKKIFIATLFLLTGLTFLKAQEQPVGKDDDQQQDLVRRPFNLGLSWGMGGAHISFFPSIDATYRPLTVRFSPGYTATTIGGSVELTTLHNMFNISPIYDHWFWVVSGYYSRKDEEGQWPFIDYSSFDLINANTYVLVTGVKVLSGKRLYSSLQFGASLERSEKILGGTQSIWSPHVEFSIGIHLWKNYSKAPASEQALSE